MELAFQPLLAFVVLTVRAVAMTARVRQRDLVIALGAACLHPWAVTGTTHLQGGKRLAMRWQDLPLVLIQECGFKGFDYR